MRHVVHVLTVADSLIFLRGQAAFMRERGWKTSVVTSPSAELDAFGKEHGVAVYGIEMMRKISPAKDAESLGSLTRLLWRLSPDLVHAHTPKGGLLGTMAARLAGVPRVVYHMRGLPLATATGKTRALLSLAERTSCRLASHVVSVSHSLRDAALSESLCKPEKISVLAGGSGNGVDAAGRFDPERKRDAHRRITREAWGLGQDDLAIGFLGRLVGDKGVRELARAWSSIRDKHPSAHLVVGGVFEPRDPVDEHTRACLTRDPRVHLLGFVRDTPGFYAGLDVLVLPTYREGFPNVLLEAAAMELPAIATRVTGCVDAICDGVTGTLVAPRDASGLALAMSRYLDDAELRRTHGRSARTRVLQEFSPTRIWTELAQLYDALCPPKGARC